MVFMCRSVEQAKIGHILQILTKSHAQALRTPQHERLSHIVSKSPKIKILENQAFHSSVLLLLAASTLSCCICKIWVFENSQYMPDFLGFQNMMILNLFHAVVVFEPEHDLLFKSASTYCALSINKVCHN